MLHLSGAQLIVKILERQGIEIIAGIPGGAILPLYDALSQSEKIHHVLAGHEQGAGFMAQGMSRISGRPEVCFASSGPGATNLVTAIADAKLDSIPMVAITGQVPLAMIGTDAFQETDTYGMTIPLTKHNFLVRDVSELASTLIDAFRIAMSGRPGPVLVDIPKDVQSAMIDIAELPAPAKADPLPVFAAELLPRCAELINRGERPVLYLGGGVIHSEAADLATKLAEQGGLPTVMTLMGLGAMPSDHPLSLGMLGMHGARCTNLIMSEADLLIVIGARFDDRAIGKAAQFCPNAKIIHIDIDSSEFNKIKNANIAINADVRDALNKLLPLVEIKLRKPWLARVAELKKSHPLQMPDLDNPRSHYGLIQAVAQGLDNNAVITTDVGQHQMWVAQAYPFRRARQWLTSGGLGTMGFGLPVAIGAALADRSRTVVCFSGDGSFKMNIQELASLAEEDLNVKIVLMNNNSLGLVYQQQSLFYGKRVFQSKYGHEVDFIKIAAGFGVRGLDLDQASDVSASLHEELQRRGPCLIHASIDREQFVYPMVPPGASNSEMIGG